MSYKSTPRLLIMEITECWDCGHYSQIVGDCMYEKGKPRSFDDDNPGIPDWCPLPKIVPEEE